MNFKDSFGETIKVGDIIQIVNRIGGVYFKAFPKYEDGNCYLAGESADLSDWVLDDVEKYEEFLEWPQEEDIIKIVFRNGKDFNSGYISHNDELKKFKISESIIQLKKK